jgi:hypothetical protein
LTDELLLWPELLDEVTDAAVLLELLTELELDTCSSRTCSTVTVSVPSRLSTTDTIFIACACSPCFVA